VSPVSCGAQRDLYRLYKITSRWRDNTSIWKKAVKKLQADNEPAREGKLLQILINLVKKAEQELVSLQEEAEQLGNELIALREKLTPCPGRNR
jgi:hypothetical protein